MCRAIEDENSLKKKSNIFGQVKIITTMTQHLCIYWSVHLVAVVVTAIDFTCQILDTQRYVTHSQSYIFLFCKYKVCLSFKVTDHAEHCGRIA